MNCSVPCASTRSSPTTRTTTLWWIPYWPPGPNWPGISPAATTCWKKYGWILYPYFFQHVVAAGDMPGQLGPGGQYGIHHKVVVRVVGLDRVEAHGTLQFIDRGFAPGILAGEQGIANQATEGLAHRAGSFCGQSGHAGVHRPSQGAHAQAQGGIAGCGDGSMAKTHKTGDADAGISRGQCSIIQPEPRFQFVVIAAFGFGCAQQYDRIQQADIAEGVLFWGCIFRHAGIIAVIYR